MKLIAYRVSDYEGNFQIEPASKFRDWMDATPNKFIYRCLPMTIANQMGWVIPCPMDFEVTWDGDQSIQFEYHGEYDEYLKSFVLSHFGYGILTFSIPFLFRTPLNYGLIVKGPTNYIKRGIQALEGFVETDWCIMTFTMNWKITEPNTPIRFAKGEPICMIMPYKIADLEQFETSIELITNNPELQTEHENWVRSRDEFHRRTDKQAHEWQKDYFKRSEITKLQLNSFD